MRPQLPLEVKLAAIEDFWLATEVCNNAWNEALAYTHPVDRVTPEGQEAWEAYCAARIAERVTSAIENRILNH